MSLPDKKDARNASWLATDDIEAQIATRSVRGGTLTTLAYGYEFAARTLTLFILARFLSHDEVGLVGVVSLVTFFFAMFSEVGLTTATIQTKNLSQGQASNLFWISASLGLLCALLAMATSPLVAWFFGDSRITPLLLLSSAGFVICGLGFQHKALIFRRMRFGIYCAVHLGAVTVGLIVAVVLASKGWGPYSLVVQNLVIYSLGTALAWLFCTWRPSLPDRESEMRPLLRFGGAIFVSGLLSFLGRQLDKMFVGRVWGLGALGLYNYAFRIGTLPGQMVGEGIGKVAVPGMSRIQDDPQRFRKYVLRILHVVTFATVPAAFVFFFFAEEVVHIALGSSWADTAPLLRAFSGVALLNPLLGSMFWIFTSRGEGRRLVTWLVAACLTFLLFFAVGSRLNLEAFVWMYSAAVVLLTVPCLLYATKGTAITLLDCLRDFLKAVLGSAIAVAGTAWLWQTQGPAGADSAGSWVAVVPLLVGGAAYLAVMMLLFRSHHVFIELFGFLRNRNPATRIS